MPFILIFCQNLCHSKLNSCVCIMSTSMHFSSIFRFIVNIIFFKNRQCINIRTSSNCFIFHIFLIIINSRNNSCIYNFKKFNTIFCQKSFYQFTCFKFFISKFRIFMNSSSNFYHFIINFINIFFYKFIYLL